MKTVSTGNICVLLEQDEPFLFVTADKRGGFYLCAIIESATDSSLYACVRVSKPELLALVTGGIDASDLFWDDEAREYYLTEINPSTTESLFLRPVNVYDLDARRFPKRGLTFDYGAEYLAPLFGAHQIAKDYQAGERMQVVYALQPPESSQLVSRINCERLIEHLNTLTKIFKKYAQVEVKKSLSDSILPGAFDWCMLIPRRGSYEICLESEIRVGEAGFTELASALQTFDSLIALSDSPRAMTSALVERNKAISAPFADFLSHIASDFTPITFSYGCGNDLSPRRSLNPEQARMAYQSLDNEVDISGIYQLVGSFVKCDTVTGKWTFRPLEGQRLTGAISPRTAVRLDGLVMFPATYEIAYEIETRDLKGISTHKTNLLTGFRRLGVAERSEPDPNETLF